MKKLIKINATTTKEMTFEEVLNDRQVQRMMKAEARKHTRECQHHVETEDLLQEMSLSVYKAYELFDVTTGFLFTTFLFNHLRDGKRRATHHLFAEKRQADQNSFSFYKDADLQNSGNAEEGEIYEVQFEDQSANSEAIFIEKEFLSLFENLSEIEKDVLKILLCEVEGKRADKKAFATKWGMSRPTAYKKIASIQNILKERVLDNGYGFEF